MRFRRAAWNLVSGSLRLIVASGLSLILTPVILRYIGAEGYGLWTIVIGISGYVALLDFGLSLAVVRFVAHENDLARVKRALSAVLTLYCAAALVAVVLGFVLAVGAPALFKLTESEQMAFSWAIFLTVAGIAVSFPISVYAGTLRGSQLGYTSDAVAIAASVASFAAAVVLFDRGWGLFALAAPPLVIGLLQAAPLLALVRRYMPHLWIGPGSLDRTVAPVLGFGFFIFLNSIAGNVVFAADLIVAGALVSVIAAGIYQVTGRVSQLIVGLVFRIADATFPAMTQLHGNRELGRAGQVHLETVKLSAALAIPCAIVYAAYNEDFVRIWLGLSSYGGVVLTLTFAFLIAQHTILHASALALLSTGRVRTVAFCSLIEAGLNLVLSLVLASSLGLVGIALGTVIAGLVTSGWFVPLAACRALAIPVRRYLLTALLPPVAIAVPFVLVVAGSHALWVPNNYLELAASTLGLLALNLAGFAALGLSADERALYRLRFGSLRRRQPT